MSLIPKAKTAAEISNGFGFGAIMGAAKTLADSGAIEKLIAFSEQVGPINERLEHVCSTIERLERTINRLEALLGSPTPTPESDGCAIIEAASGTNGNDGGGADDRFTAIIFDNGRERDFPDAFCNG